MGMQDILKSVEDAVKALHQQSNVSHPKADDVRNEAEKFGTRTSFGNYNFVSTVKNRSAGATVYIGSDKVRQHSLSQKQKDIIKNLPAMLNAVHEYMKKAPIACVENSMGDNPVFMPRCALFVSVARKEMIRLAHMVSQTLFTPRDSDVKFSLVYIPEWQEKDRQILVFPEIGVTYVLGSDYYGEAKKGFLRMAMWHAKQRGMLGLHAGSKIIRVRNEGKMKKYGMLIFGLTATGKTTHSCHDHGLAGDEGIEIVQDDVVFLCNNGSVLGTEKGFYLKTEGVNPKTQALIYNAITKRDAIFENVFVDYKGNVDFDNDMLTGNGRGIMQRDDFGAYKSDSVNIPLLDEVDGMIIAFITRRNTVVPIASKLTIEQAAAAFMLGESIETSGSDPTRIGESVRVVGTNPFIIGDEAEEGNMFYEFLKRHADKIQCYLLNTGGVGEIAENTEQGRVVKQKVLRVEIPEMASIIRGIARGAIKWKKDDNWGVLVPAEVEGIDIKRFDLDKFYSNEQINRLVESLNHERKEYMEGFAGLNPDIKNAFD